MSTMLAARGRIGEGGAESLGTQSGVDGIGRDDLHAAGSGVPALSAPGCMRRIPHRSHSGISETRRKSENAATAICGGDLAERAGGARAEAKRG